ncbi:MAG: ABC transporter substrate-binding protein [Hyphomicrobiales bacterium]|nr:ABC transporter substrate-binding protein [Hyphomicrobiales bacterium]
MPIDQMKRREFITFIGGVAAGWPLAAHSQQTRKTYHIAVVSPATPVSDISEASDSPYFSALFKELRRLGYVEGKNLVVARYSGQGREEHFPELCRDVVSTRPDVIVTAASGLVLSFKATTDSIPIVASMADPVSYGIAASLARPGSNITGVAVEAGLEIWGKRLQVLHEAVPTASNMGFLASRRVWQGPQIDAIEKAATQMGIAILGPPLESPIGEAEYRRVIVAMVEEHMGGMIVSDQSENGTYRRPIVEVANNARIPAVYPYREHFEIGGLIAYGPSIADIYYHLADYTDRILKGAQPSETPIYQVSKFELLINLKTAKILGLTVPPTLLARADDVIE